MAVTNTPMAQKILDRFGKTPGDTEYGDLVVKIMNDPNYGLNKSKSVKKEPVTVTKTTIAKKPSDKLNQALDEAQKRQKKYTSGVSGWFK